MKKLEKLDNWSAPDPEPEPLAGKLALIAAVLLAASAAVFFSGCCTSTPQPALPCEPVYLDRPVTGEQLVICHQADIEFMVCHSEMTTNEKGQCLRVNWDRLATCGLENEKMMAVHNENVTVEPTE